MLRFDLSEIIRTPGMRQVYDIYEPPYVDDDVEYVSPITGRINITNTGSLLLVRGQIETVIAQECSRCLEPVRAPIKMTLEEDFDLQEVEDSRHHTQIQVKEDDETSSIFDDRVLHLDALIRQAALLEAPLQPLCRENCPGIAIRSDSDSDQASSPFHQLSQLLEN